jgi:ABC-type antimicrobial peptide transport system permease subunit
VVGVIETTRHEGEYTEAWYLPFAQNATGPSATNAHLMARVAGDSRSLAPAIRAIISDIDPELALYEVSTMDALVAGNLRQDRLGAVVSTLFALGGLLLAALGIYGVLGFAVNADRREIGVRLALGASRLDVLRLVVGRGLRLTMTGIAVGAAVAYAVAFSLARVVPEVRFDVRLVGVAILVLLAASMVAMLAPTRRALRVDPLRSLRAD